MARKTRTQLHEFEVEVEKLAKIWVYVYAKDEESAREIVRGGDWKPSDETEITSDFSVGRVRPV
jgi:gamma-glutamylcyclotransferase (GGCT)/AIG2-like uncharacterized protein YtfP